MSTALKPKQTCKLKYKQCYANINAQINFYEFIKYIQSTRSIKFRQTFYFMRMTLVCYIKVIKCYVAMVMVAEFQGLAWLCWTCGMSRGVSAHPPFPSIQKRHPCFCRTLRGRLLSLDDDHTICFWVHPINFSLAFSWDSQSSSIWAKHKSACGDRNSMAWVSHPIAPKGIYVGYF